MGTLGETHRVPLARCTYCGEHNDAATGIDHDSNPKPGDAMICVTCSGLSIYAEDGRLRRPTPAEVKACSKDLKLQLARLAVFKLALERRGRK